MTIIHENNEFLIFANVSVMTVIRHNDGDKTMMAIKNDDGIWA